jgi:hypothetical protein
LEGKFKFKRLAWNGSRLSAMSKQENRDAHWHVVNQQLSHQRQSSGLDGAFNRAGQINGGTRV